MPGSFHTKWFKIARNAKN
uniref:Uncharacterized protein n=1 Tax=Arundo donax TaxID=35708 RepID=A0A0A8ZV24_ARUDO